MNNNNKEKLCLLHDKSGLSDSFTDSTKTDSTPKSSPDTQISFPDVSKSPTNSVIIKEVYEDNFLEELNIISELIDEYNYIGMDTEFPGTVYNVKNITNDFYYKTLKVNIDSLKIIQLGITLSNEHGEYPKSINYHTWQFNFHFDLDKDNYNEESITLLKKSGINFEKLKNRGIKHNVFAQYLMTSGLVLNPDIYWVSYQGSYDFGYLLKLLINEKLPPNEDRFIDSLNLYFHNYLDVKILVKDKEYYFNGGLNKLINKLRISRKGIMHQAGSDSIATIETYISLINYYIINNDKIQKLKNILYGIGAGQDNANTINYTTYQNSTNNNSVNNNIIPPNNNNFFVNDIPNNNKIPNNNQISYPQTNNCNYKNMKINWFCPVVLVNPYGMRQRTPMTNDINSQINSKNEFLIYSD